MDANIANLIATVNFIIDYTCSFRCTDAKNDKHLETSDQKMPKYCTEDPLNDKPRCKRYEYANNKLSCKS